MPLCSCFSWLNAVETVKTRSFVDTSRFAFSAPHGSVLEKAWNSTRASDYLDRFYAEDQPLDIVFISVPAWATATNIPCRTVRLQRTVDGARTLFQNDVPIGSWELSDRGWIEFIYPPTEERPQERRRFYENAPGTEMWIRRAENWKEEAGWATFLAPLVQQFEGDLRPNRPHVNLPPPQLNIPPLQHD